MQLTTGASAYAEAGLSFSVDERGLVASISDPNPTKSRGLGGVAILDGVDPNTGISSANIGLVPYLYTDLFLTEWSLTKGYQLSGNTLGLWNYPLSSMTFTPRPAFPWHWSVDLFTGSASIYYEYSAGSGVHITRSGAVDALAQAIKSMMENPVHKLISLNATDSGGSETIPTVVSIHGPLEITGEKWASDWSVSNRISDSTDFMGWTANPSQYHGKLFYSIFNSSSTPIQVQATINSDYTYTVGIELGASITGEAPVKAMKLTFGASATYSSTSQWSMGTSLSAAVSLDPGKTLEAWIYPKAHITFPVVAKYNRSGFLQDTHHAVLDNPAYGLWIGVQ